MPKPGKKPEGVESAGGVVLNPRGDVLVVNQNGDSWSLPKGHVDSGESALEAARREIHEESGVKSLRYIRRLGSYKRPRIGKNGSSDRSQMKHITLFLFTTKQTALRPLDPRNPQARWVPRSKVAALLTHAIDKSFFRSHLKGLPKGEKNMNINGEFLADYLSPLGRLRVSGQGASISGISMVSGGRLPAGQAGSAGKLPARIRHSLDLYFSGKKGSRHGHFLLKGTPFQKKVWTALSSIPWGESISYAELARRVKRPRAVRAVAGAVGRNPVVILIPCHRVVGSDGSLTGYAYGLKKKAWLLGHEKLRRG